MNKRSILSTCSGISIAVCFLLWTGSRTFQASSFQIWAWGIATLVSVGVLIWALRLKDPVPDFLREAGLDYFERDGFCFVLAPGVIEGRLVLHVLYQSRYSEPSRADILVRPIEDSKGPSLCALKLRVDCEGGSAGEVAVPWQATAIRPGREVECCIGADVEYPNGRGNLIRSRTGSPASSIEEASASELAHLLVTPTKLKFPFPEGVARSEAATPTGAHGQPAFVEPPGVVRSAKVTARKSGSREINVVCEKCHHPYQYTLRREATATAEAPDQDLARSKAEQEAGAQLRNLLATGSDIVPCPKCEALTTRMRTEKKNNRQLGLGLVGFGVVLMLVGLAICGVVYLIQAGTGRLFWVVGVFGVLILGFGVYQCFQGLCHAVTGESIEDSARDKGTSDDET